MHKRCIVLTVGVGGKNRDSLMDALKKSIEDYGPNLIAFVFSHTSEELTNELKSKLGDSYEYVDLKLSDENKIDVIFSEMVSLLDELVNHYGCSKKRMQLDFTSGTKAMSAGAALAATSCQIDKLRYISGQRKDGVVQSGLEEILTHNPTRFLSYYSFQQCLKDLESLRYDSALSIYESILPDALPASARDSLTSLKLLIEGYCCWDQFKHGGARDKFRLISNTSFYLRPFQFPIENCCLLTNLDHASQSSNAQKDASPKKESKNAKLNQDILSDMFNNAQRRLLEGKYDDALARLYRLTEMFAQFVLIKKHKIDTSDVDQSKVPPISEYKIRFINGRAKIGMKDAYELLEALGDEVGKNFMKNKKMESLLQERNLSILAHGTKPIEKSTCIELNDHIYNLISTVIPGFEELCKKLQFSWLKKRLAQDFIFRHNNG